MIEEKLNKLVLLLMKILRKSEKNNPNQYSFYINPIFLAEQKRITKAVDDYDSSENKYIYNEYFLNSIYRISNFIKVINPKVFEIIKENEVIKKMLLVRNCIAHPEESYENGNAPIFDMYYMNSFLDNNTYFNSTDISISRNSYENEIKDDSKNSPEKKVYHMQSLHNVASIKNVKNSFIESIDIIIKSLKNYKFY